MREFSRKPNHHLLFPEANKECLKLTKSMKTVYGNPKKKCKTRELKRKPAVRLQRWGTAGKLLFPQLHWSRSPHPFQLSILQSSAHTSYSSYFIMFISTEDNVPSQVPILRRDPMLCLRLRCHAFEILNNLWARSAMPCFHLELHPANYVTVHLYVWLLTELSALWKQEWVLSEICIPMNQYKAFSKRPLA